MLGSPVAAALRPSGAGAPRRLAATTATDGSFADRTKKEALARLTPEDFVTILGECLCAPAVVTFNRHNTVQQLGKMFWTECSAFSPEVAKEATEKLKELGYSQLHGYEKALAAIKENKVDEYLYEFYQTDKPPVFIQFEELYPDETSVARQPTYLVWNPAATLDWEGMVVFHAGCSSVGNALYGQTDVPMFGKYTARPSLAAAGGCNMNQYGAWYNAYRDHPDLANRTFEERCKLLELQSSHLLLGPAVFKRCMNMVYLEDSMANLARIACLLAWLRRYGHTHLDVSAIAAAEEQAATLDSCEAYALADDAIAEEWDEVVQVSQLYVDSCDDAEVATYVKDHTCAAIHPGKPCITWQESWGDVPPAVVSAVHTAEARNQFVVWPDKMEELERGKRQRLAGAAHGTPASGPSANQISAWEADWPGIDFTHFNPVTHQITSITHTYEEKVKKYLCMRLLWEDWRLIHPYNKDDSQEYRRRQTGVSAALKKAREAKPAP